MLCHVGNGLLFGLGKFVSLLVFLRIAQLLLFRLLGANLLAERCGLGGEGFGEFVREGAHQGMGRIDDKGELVGHGAVESHTLLVLRHLLHAAHPLVLGKEDRQTVGTGLSEGDSVGCFRIGIGFRQQSLEAVA